MKTNKMENLVWIVFGILGIMFLAVAIFLNYWAIIPAIDRAETVATITEIKYRNSDDESPDVWVSYEVDGNNYLSVLGSYSSSYYEGKEIKIYYDKNDPGKIMDDTPKILMYVFGGIGVFFLVVSITNNLFKLRTKRMIQKLKETGYVVNAKYLSTQINKNYTVNNRHPYNIICEWDNTMDGKRHLFKSKNIWCDPAIIIKQRNIKTFRVYFNPNNLKQYYVDVDIVLDNMQI